MNQYRIFKPASFLDRKNSYRKILAFEPKKPKFNLRFGKIEKTVTVIIIIAILVVSAFGFLMQADLNPSTVKPIVNDPTTTPTNSSSPNSTIGSPITTITPPKILDPEPIKTPATPGLFASSQYMNSSAWKSVAKYAWTYFQPGIGLDSTTGLPAASLGWNYFTDWDLGVYIQAVIDAQKLGLISPDQEWGSSIRLEKVVEFLEKRDLVLAGDNSSKIPYWFYSSTGEGYKSQPVLDLADTGTLLVALNNLKTFNSSLASRINDIVYNNVHGFSNRTDYANVVSSIKAEAQASTSLYAYYMSAGFAAFFSALKDAPEQILTNIITAPTVNTYNVTLPKAQITCEPLLYSFFYLNYNPKLATLVNQTYAAHEAKYNAEGQYVAFSEGSGVSGDFIYEFVVLPNGETWKILKDGDYIDMTAIVYTKVAVSFLSIYNSTFSKNMCIFLENNMSPPDKGYWAGVTTQGSPVYNLGCNTNSLILAASRYAVYA